MSAKPTLHAEWDTNDTHTTPTTADHKDNGYGTDEIPASDEENYWKRLVSDWTKYLLDGDVVLNTLMVTSATAYALTANQDNCDPLGTGALAGVFQLNVRATDDWNLGGLVGGVLGKYVRIVNAGAASFHMRNQGTSTTAAHRFAFGIADVANNALVRVAAGGSVTIWYDGSRWRVVAMTGCMVQRTIIIPTFNAHRVDSNTVIIGYDNGILGIGPHGGVVTFHVPLTLPAGSQVESYEYYAKKSSDAVTVITTRLKSRNALTDAVVDYGSGVTNSAAAPGAITLAEGAIEADVATSHVYFLALTHSDDGSGGVSDYFYNLNLTLWTYL